MIRRVLVLVLGAALVATACGTDEEPIQPEAEADRPFIITTTSLLGDIVVSPAIALQQFVDHAGTLDAELALLVIHGVLHVLGHDHADPAEGAVMRDREAALLRQLHWRGDPPEAFRHDHTR